MPEVAVGFQELVSSFTNDFSLVNVSESSFLCLFFPPWAIKWELKIIPVEQIPVGQVPVSGCTPLPGFLVLLYFVKSLSISFDFC